MSLITRCPACETLFKVVPDQLRISDGWVRCGQCDEVFDASAHLVKEVSALSAPPMLAQDPVAAPALFPGVTPENAKTVTSQFLDLDLDFSDIQTPEVALVVPDVVAEPVIGNEQAVSAEQLVPDLESAVTLIQEPLEGGKADAADSVVQPEVSAQDVSFLRTQRDESNVRKPLVRAGLVLLVFFLLLTLAGQFIFHERNRLAAHEPRLTPWLLTFCEPLGCSLAPLQGIESVVIESSAFSKVRGESYKLSFTLKNTSAMALAMPAVELTLTDSLDQPLLRRVVLPAQWAAPNDTLDAGRTLPITVNFSVKLDSASERMAGYRLLAFYP